MSDAAADRPIVDAEPATPAASPTSSGDDTSRRTGYRSRFAAVYFTLAVIAGGAIGAFLVLLASPDAAEPPAWSSFRPEGSANARLNQIVDKIPQRYRRGDGSQLVSVSVTSPPQAPVVSQDGQSVIPVPVQRIAFEDGGDFHVIDTQNTLQFTLCGNGRECVFDTGTPSVERFELVQRQALELALYTFKYVEGVEAVTVLLPPSIPQSQLGAETPELQRTALFLRRGDVERQLAQPLQRTLAGQAPAIGEASSGDLEAIRSLSTPHIYSYSLTQNQDGAFMLVFRPA